MKTSRGCPGLLHSHIRCAAASNSPGGPSGPSTQSMWPCPLDVAAVATQAAVRKYLARTRASREKRVKDMAVEVLTAEHWAAARHKRLVKWQRHQHNEAVQKTLDKVAQQTPKKRKKKKHGKKSSIPMLFVSPAIAASTLNTSSLQRKRALSLPRNV